MVKVYCDKSVNDYYISFLVLAREDYKHIKQICNNSDLKIDKIYTGDKRALKALMIHAKEKPFNEIKCSFKIGNLHSISLYQD